MTLKEKLARETGQQIYLYKQDVFWVSYEQSALVLSRYKPLKLSVKFVKTVNRQVVSAGFPDATLLFFSSIFGNFTETENNAGYSHPADPHDDADIHGQMEQILQQHAARKDPSDKMHPDTLAEKILAFNLATKTPMEAMIFFKDLHDQIRQDMTGA